MWVQTVSTGGVVALAYAPDSRTLYTLDTGGWLTAWNTATRKRDRLFQLGKDDRHVRAMHLAKGGRFFVIKTAFRDFVWDAETGTGRELPLPPLPSQALSTERGEIVPDPLAPRIWYLTPDRRSALSWDLERAAWGPTATGWPWPAGPSRFVIAPDGTFILMAIQLILLFDPTAGQVTGVLPLDLYYLRHGITPDSRFLVLAGVASAQVWDLPSRTIYLDSMTDLPAGPMAFHPTAPTFLAQGQNNALTLFSLETGTAVRSFDITLGNEVRCVAFAPDGLTCAAGGSNKRFVVFDVDV